MKSKYDSLLGKLREEDSGSGDPTCTINGAQPDANGNFSVTAESIGAAEAEHQHEIADVENLQATLDAKADSGVLPEIRADDNGRIVKARYALAGGFGNELLDAKASSLLRCCKFSEGAMLADSSPASGTLATFGTAPKALAEGKCGYGITNYGGGISSELISQQGGFLYASLWVRQTNAYNSNILSYATEDDTTVAALRVESRRPMIYIWDQDGETWVVRESAAYFTLNTWYHVLCAFDMSGTVSLYINGALDGTATLAVTPWAAAQLLIGSMTKTSGQFRGDLDEICVWRSATSLFANAAEELAFAQALYNGGSGLFYESGLQQGYVLGERLANAGGSANAGRIAVLNVQGKIAQSMLTDTVALEGSGGATIPFGAARNQIQAVFDAIPRVCSGSSISFDAPTVHSFDGSSSITGDGSIATATLPGHDFAVGDIVYIDGTVNFDATALQAAAVSSVSGDSFSFPWPYNGSETPPSTAIARKAYVIDGDLGIEGRFFIGGLTLQGPSASDSKLCPIVLHFQDGGFGVRRCHGDVRLANIRIAAAYLDGGAHAFESAMSSQVRLENCFLSASDDASITGDRASGLYATGGANVLMNSCRLSGRAAIRVDDGSVAVLRNCADAFASRYGMELDGGLIFTNGTTLTGSVASKNIKPTMVYDATP
ncbi:MAG: hypothetical protein BWY31_04584 [Lentisphaerae bacterium ADurb.Bin242]|nr:MAG: hypothetical protein BWY31_04584 [Lentisphaerae bacterium ADurb.Bin242]